jgi:hypothetical protein
MGSILLFAFFFVAPRLVLGGLSDADINDSYSTWKAGRGTAFTHSRLLSKTLGAVHPTEAAADESSVALHWIIKEETIRIAVAVEATGWVALGFTEMGGMPGADIVVFEGATKKLYDSFSVAYERPQVDQQQDWTLLNSITDDGVMIFEAERKLDTGDSMDWPLTDDTSLLEAGTKLLAAWGETAEMHYHNPDNRLQAAVRLFADSDRDSDKELFDRVMSDEAEGSVSLHFDDFTVPDKWPTWYEWKCVTVADLVKMQGLPADKPVHLIGFEFLLDPGSLIHHIVVYSGTQDKIPKCDPYRGPTSVMHVWNRCQSNSFFFPENIGMLLADESSRAGRGLGIPPKSFRLEIHYENPKKMKGSMDSSGVRLHYTSKLREYTGATLELADPQVKLLGKPIGQGIRQHTFTCPASCTKKHLPPQGVTVLYELLHMHKKGQTMEIVHQRDGETADAALVQYYDFGSGGQVLRNNYTILPGDTFQTHCTYDGNKDLQFGFEARREMCLGTVFYYPASVSAHLSCTVKSGVKECVSDHSAVSLHGVEDLKRSFGVESPDMSKSAIVPRTTVGLILAAFCILLIGVAAGVRMKRGRSRRNDKYKRVETDSSVEEDSERECSSGVDYHWFRDSSARSRVSRLA